MTQQLSQTEFNKLSPAALRRYSSWARRQTDGTPYYHGVLNIKTNRVSLEISPPSIGQLFAFLLDHHRFDTLTLSVQDGFSIGSINGITKQFEEEATNESLCGVLWVQVKNILEE